LVWIETASSPIASKEEEHERDANPAKMSGWQKHGGGS